MQSDSSAKKRGVASLVLFVIQISGIAALIIYAQFSDGRGHISGPAIFFLFVTMGICLLSPVGFLLGLAGAPRENRKSQIGLVGNLVLAVLGLAIVIFL